MPHQLFNPLEHNPSLKIFMKRIRKGSPEESKEHVQFMLSRYLQIPHALVNPKATLQVLAEIKANASPELIKSLIAQYQSQLLTIQLPSSLPSRQAAFDAIHNARKLSGEEEYSDLEIEATRAFIIECTGLPAKFIRLPLVWAVFDKVTAEDQSLDQVSTFLENVEKKTKSFLSKLAVDPLPLGEGTSN